MRVLDIGLTWSGIQNTKLKINVFEGPEAADIYHYPHTQLLLQDEMVYCMAFQAFVRIQCGHLQCMNIHIHYIWQMVSARHLIADARLSLKSPFGFCPRHYRSLMHCAYVITNYQSKYLRITFPAISFSGPDYSVNLPGENMCTLGGVAIADILRRTIIMGNSIMHLETDGAISRGLVVDAIFPEITRCFRDTHVDNSKSSEPSKGIFDFVSTSDSIIIVLYAYEEYVNLDRSTEITIDVSRCIGVTYGCYHIPGNGYVQVGYTPRYRMETRLLSSPLNCPHLNMLLVDFLDSP